MEPLRYVFQKLEKNEKKNVWKILYKVFLHRNRIDKDFWKSFVAKEKKRIFAKLQFHYRKERNNSSMAVEVMVLKCGKDPSWQKKKKNHYDKHNFEIHKKN